MIGLDSAWLCGDDNDQGRIVLTDEQVLGHVQVGERKLDGLRIALVHHPLNHLLDHHDVRRLLGDNGVDLLLHGHQHDPLSMDIVEPGASLRIIAAGSLMEGDRGKDWPNGFQLIELDPTTLGGAVHFRKWVPRGRFWTPGTDLYEKAVNGVLPLVPGGNMDALMPDVGHPGAGPPARVQDEQDAIHNAFPVAARATEKPAVPLSFGIAGVDAGQTMSRPRGLTAPPPMLLAYSKRTRSVAELTKLLNDRHVVTLGGPPGSGKTHLARLVVNHLSVSGAWLPLRDQHVDACVDALAYARASLGRAPMVIVDDLPRVEGGSLLEGELAKLATSVVSRQGRLLVLSHFPLPTTSLDLFEYASNEAPAMTPEEVAEYFEVLGAPEQLRSEQNTKFIADLAHGLPLLVAAAARYLAERSWTLDVDALIDLLKGMHATGLRDEIVRRVLKTVTVDNARELLFRLLLVGDAFNNAIVDVVSQVAPRCRVPARISRGALSDVQEADVWAAATAGAAIGPRLVASLPDLASDLMLTAIRSWGEAVNPLGERLLLPYDFPIQALPLFATMWVEEPSHVGGILRTLEKMDRTELEEAFTFAHIDMPYLR